MPINRPDMNGTHKAAYIRNKKRIFATQEICAICGNPVDPSYKFPHPLSRTVDHIIPIAKGGHPSDIDNLQLAHFTCNRQKSDKIFHVNETKGTKDKEIISNRVLPHHVDWKNF